MIAWSLLILFLIAGTLMSVYIGSRGDVVAQDKGKTGAKVLRIDDSMKF